MNDMLKYKNKLCDVLRQHTDLEESSIKEMMPGIELIFYSKGDSLLQQGDAPEFSYYIIEGCVRQYITGEDGKEVTVEFYKEDQSINIFSYIDAAGHSFYSLECLENCVLSPCPHVMDEDLEDSYPEISKMLKYFYKSQTTDIQKKYASFKIMKPEERFLDFIVSEPELMKRVPQTILASYLDITPETFSRFKTRFLK